MNDQIKTAKVITHERLVEKGWNPLLKPVRRIANTTEDNDSPESNSGPFLELNDLCLIGADFSDLDLKFAKFTDCDLSSVNFDRCNLFKATFKECILYNATFDNAVLVDVNFHDSKLFGIRLKRAEIHGMGSPDIIKDLICRERWDSDSSLAFRGTAGLEEYKSVYNHSGIKDLAFTSMDDLPNNLIDNKDSKLIPGMNTTEIVERCSLYSDIFKDRWKKLEIGIPVNLPNPSGDAFPEDSTCMMLRSFRQCFEKQGRKYHASYFRFWETTYLTASKWRIIQSKILQTGASGYWSRLLRLVSARFPALVAWSLLHPHDERRVLGILGRKQSTKESRCISVEDKGATINGGSVSGFIFHTFLLVLFFLMVVGGSAMKSNWGICIGPVLLVVLFSIPACCMVRKKHLRPENRGVCKELKDNLIDLYRAAFEFAQHTTCGHGERPWRAIGVLLGWIVLFGVLYSFIPALQFNNDVGKAFGSRFDQSLYYSIVSATTLGFGEITPDSLRLQRLVCIEVLGAMTLTVIFIASLTRKLIGR